MLSTTQYISVSVTVNYNVEHILEHNVEHILVEHIVELVIEHMIEYMVEHMVERFKLPDCLSNKKIIFNCKKTCLESTKDPQSQTISTVNRACQFILSISWVMKLW